MKKTTILTLLLSVTCSSMADAALKIYYIRHAEGGHNVKKAWVKKGVPEAEWPAYVGNPDMFTPRGEKEVVLATEKLQKYKFDFIASSPLWRCRNTILPYLKATQQTAEIWPELREGPGMVTILDEGLPEVTDDIFNNGREIELADNEKGIYSIRTGGEKTYTGAPKGSSEELRVAYTKHAALQTIKMIESRFGDSDKSILLAGHNSSGVSLLKLLLKEAPTGKAQGGLTSSAVWMVERQEDGSYELKMYNDEPYTSEEKKAEPSK